MRQDTGIASKHLELRQGTRNAPIHQISAMILSTRIQHSRSQIALETRQGTRMTSRHEKCAKPVIFHFPHLQPHPPTNPSDLLLYSCENPQMAHRHNNKVPKNAPFCWKTCFSMKKDIWNNSTTLYKKYGKNWKLLLVFRDLIGFLQSISGPGVPRGTPERRQEMRQSTLGGHLKKVRKQQGNDTFLGHFCRKIGKMASNYGWRKERGKVSLSIYGRNNLMDWKGWEKLFDIENVEKIGFWSKFWDFFHF